MNKLLTIVIPTYNTEQYLSRCLDSLIVPEFMDQLEVLIVIDGSPDNSIAVAKQYEAKYPGTFIAVDKENGGHGSTINKGIELATGKYFRVLDSDDWFDTDQFTSYLKDLSNLDVDMVLTNFSRELLYKNESINEIFTDVEYNVVFDAENFDYTRVKIPEMLRMACMTYSTEVIRKSKLKLFEKCFYVDVQYASFVLLYVKNFIFLNYNIYKYLIGRDDQSMSTVSYNRNILQHHKVMLSCAEYISKNLSHRNLSHKERQCYDSLLEKTNRHFINTANWTPLFKAAREISSYSKELKSLYPFVYAECRTSARLIKLLTISPAFALILWKIKKIK